MADENRSIQSILLELPPKSIAKCSVRSRKHRLSAVARQACVTCGVSHTRGTNRCELCTKRAIESNNARRAQRRAFGKCEVCGDEWNGSSKRCESCKAESKLKWLRRAGSEYCSRCGELRDGPQKACSKCRKHQRESACSRRIKKFENGACTQCGRAHVGTTVLCDYCILRAAARRYLGSSKQWRKLRELLESQNSRCAYTSVPLSLGDNASVDHKIPRAMGGLNHDIKNIQWVTWAVNRSKTDLSHEEFVEMCHRVAERFERPEWPKDRELLPGNRKRTSLKNAARKTAQ